MDSGLRGKHILITGASGGIGQAIARCFDEEG
jgi:NAD(P)-dependent dehydrogenase (short-subunit alcohol dehydrogenase family)